MIELNLDGLVGPTHHYGGLSYGNQASMKHQAALSNPKQAALQGLMKMEFLHERGFKQGLLPPHERPNINALREKGFSEKNLDKVPADLLSACFSAAAMWTANAATMTPSRDSGDGKLHFTPANLSHNFHRSLEAPQTAHSLKTFFRSPSHFIHHDPVESKYGDEGAANHTRLGKDQGVHFFVYGKTQDRPEPDLPQKFPARQTREASERIAHNHGLKENQLVFAQQSPEAIDAGAFHNDVVAVGNGDFLFFHERAFVESGRVLDELKRKLEDAGQSFNPRCVLESEVPLAMAVETYLFNSQILSRNDQMTLIAPMEVKNNPVTEQFVQNLISDSACPLSEVHYLDLRQSMRNGGGPACLRLRIPLTQDEIHQAHPHLVLDTETFRQLMEWAEVHYRDRLSANDLTDPKLIDEVHTALDKLTQILGFGSFYRFQRHP